MAPDFMATRFVNFVYQHKYKLNESNENACKLAETLLAERLCEVEMEMKLDNSIALKLNIHIISYICTNYSKTRVIGFLFVSKEFLHCHIHASRLSCLMNLCK